MDRRAMIKAGATPQTSREIVKADTSPRALERSNAQDERPNEIEITKALRIGYAPVADLTIHFRKFAEHTAVGSAGDTAQTEKLRVEAAEMAFAIKQTVPTVTWDWLCKILSDEYTKTVVESEEKMRRVRRYYGANPVPETVERFHKK